MHTTNRLCNHSADDCNYKRLHTLHGLTTLPVLAGTQPLSREGKQALLEAHFRQFFAQQQHFMLGEQSASLRSGQIAPDQRGLVKKVGSRFQLEGLDLPSTQLLLSLRQMNLDFINTGNVPKWRQTLQLFRLVAAPGQGKVRNSHTQLDLIVQQHAVGFIDWTAKDVPYDHRSCK